MPPTSTPTSGLKPLVETKVGDITLITSYLYFMVAPKLVYQTAYPREQTNWYPAGPACCVFRKKEAAGDQFIGCSVLRKMPPAPRALPSAQI